MGDIFKIIKTKYSHQLNARVVLLEGYTTLIHKQYDGFETIVDQDGKRYEAVYAPYNWNEVIGYKLYDEDLKADFDYIAEMDWED